MSDHTDRGGPRDPMAVWFDRAKAAEEKVEELMAERDALRAENEALKADLRVATDNQIAQAWRETALKDAP